MLRLDPEEVTADGPQPYDELSQQLMELELDQRRKVMEGREL